MLSITYKPFARIDLEDIWSYTLEKWSVEQAEFYVREIYNELKKLSIHPSIAKSVIFNEVEYLQFKINHHFAFCRATYDELMVIRILHERMDFQRHL
ncbi:MAG: type II toxin-antitoxin system RelE/ParE family toxin [Bacteroidetes bacterium]|nr:type II toxin-antitoxin system RelE/ParE family toxin [Bacteroidota bacterium]MBP6314742.1 type II toxin-antitoxin system RelE/ParE family toxin [Chitinophagaceae bacterium]